MPRYEKWLTGASPETPTDRVARRALRMRLRAVAHYLDKSVGGDDEAEHVHQIRVWSRRASAALRLFSPAVPKGAKNRVKKTLRRLRRRAGAIRDCDVY